MYSILGRDFHQHQLSNTTSRLQYYPRTAGKRGLQNQFNLEHQRIITF